MEDRATEASKSMSKVHITGPLDRVESSTSETGVAPAAPEDHRSNPAQPDRVRTIAITATFTAEPIAEPMNFLLAELGMAYHVQFAPYQQVFQELLDASSLVRRVDGVAVLLVRF